MAKATSIAFATRPNPSNSICRRATSRLAISCWFGLVEACVNTASWNCASTVWKSTSLTSSIDPCRSADIDLGRVGLIDPEPNLARVGYQPRIEQRVIRRICTELGTLLLVIGRCLRLAQTGLDFVGRPHGCAWTKEGREAREAEPGFIP